jgi:NAD(P)-dependent dehydrogenase (short-subunit alcohol dehydrogenase family)
VDELRFDGRVAIVTGAGRGVGRAHALLLASRGAHIVVADLGGALDGSGHSNEPADEVVKEIVAGGGQAVACYASVADEAGSTSIVEAALNTFGRLDIVINNAGIADPEWFESLTLDQFRRMIDVHYFGTLHVCKAAWPHLQESGYGRVVNTTSEAATGTVPKNTSYGAAKGAVWGFTRALALDAAKEPNIKVNAIAPRAGTRLSDPSVMAKVFDRPEDMFGDLSAVLPPDGVSPAVAFLAHEDCPLNGEALICGGGIAQRLVMLETAGITSDAMTPEFIAENLDALMDVSVDPDVITVGVRFVDDE